jgi:mevalonate kinase
MKTDFYSHGKLLITAEYLVLDGAKSLAVPTKKGQHLKVTDSEKGVLNWKSIDAKGEIWFEQTYQIAEHQFLPKKKQLTTEGELTCKALQHILAKLELLQSGFFHQKGFKIETILEFPRDWGLGSSSTLINNLADWADINPYELLKNTFGGSGYDLACAKHNKPIIFQLNDAKATVQEIEFDPTFKEELFFVHLNQKQNSRKAIQHYKKQDLTKKQEWIREVNLISEKLLKTNEIESFENLLNKHEKILSSILGLPTVKKRLFSDYGRSIKSLGGWGGDFVMATGSKKDQEYFSENGYKTILSFKEMIF